MKKHGLCPYPGLSSWLVVCVIFTALASTLRAEDPAVVRLSYVKDTVTVKQADASIVSHAVANLPLFDGSTIVTGQDGQAEIEFTDGSVARLTPNSSLVLTHLQRLGGAGHTELRLASGLAYFELNVGQGQRFSVDLGAAVLRPMENSIFRASLDKVPEAAVMRGSLHLDAVGGASDFNQEVIANQTVRFNTSDPASSIIAEEVAPDSWDQWNIDRDRAITQQAQVQTPVRDSSQAPNDPGWNDLDAYGNWYPVDGYGDVWTPGNVDADWDPFGYGYWGNFPGYGATWISGYSWGWLPYHCGAWNYFPFGWGWIPGGCGGGWSPLVTVWNTPPNYRLPAWPKGGFIVPSQHRPPIGGGLVTVDRRPGGPTTGVHNRPGTTGSNVFVNRGMRSSSTPTVNHGQAIQLNGQTIMPIAATQSSSGAETGTGVAAGTGHVGVPVSRSFLLRGAGLVGDRTVQRLGQDSVPAGASRNTSAPSRPLYTPPASIRMAPSAPIRSASPLPAPASHVTAPPPAAGRPH